MASPHSILNDHYGIESPELERLDGELNTNYRVRKGHHKWIFKVYHPDASDPGFLEAENRVLSHLTASRPDAFPRPQENTAGDLVTVVSEIRYKLFSYVEGELMKNASYNIELAHSLGTFLAETDRALSDLDFAPLKHRSMPWDLNHFLENEPLLPHITDTTLRKTVHYFFMKYRDEVWPVQSQLPHSIIHSDANDWNVLVKDGRVSGLIDFGDMVYSQRINETAIALAYLMFGKEDPLAWAGAFIKGYHAILPYQEMELSVLYYLVAARLSITICRSSYLQQQEPGHTYMQVSAGSARLLIQKWITINPLNALNHFRSAAGMETRKPPASGDSLKKRNRYISRSLSVSYPNPILMTGAAFQYMFDQDGRTYLDAQNNIPHVGHTHPRVVEAGRRQMAQLNTNTRYLYPGLADYAERLLEKFPEPLNKVFLVNSGSAATDLALRMAMNHTGHEQVMVLEHGYHGNTRLGIDVSHYKFGGKGGKGQASTIVKVPLPDAYRSPCSHDEMRTAQHYVQKAAVALHNSSRPVGAFLAEPVVGCGGQVPLPLGYLKDVYALIRKQGGVCISDEVQVGFGRLGEWFWGFERHDVVPDLVILGKPMGNGHPLGAVITTDAINASFENGMEFFSSFGGNPVSCAIGMAVLDVLEEEKLQEQALETGAHLKKLLTGIKKEYDWIGDVRGSGLFLGVEMVKDPVTKEPYTALSQYVKNELRDGGFLIGTDGPYDQVLKIKPPMCFDKDNARELADAMRHILENFIPSQ